MSTKSASSPGVASHTPPANFRATRAATKAGALQTNVTPQLATLEKKKTKAKEAKEVETEARKLLIGENCLNEENIITHPTLLRTLSLIIQKYSPTAPQSLTKALTALSALMHEANNATSQFTPVMEALTKKIGERFEKSLQEEMDKMSTTLKNALADQSKSLNPPESMTEAVTTLKQVAADMNKSINDAQAATSQITDTALTYKQALLQTTVPQLVKAQHTRPHATATEEDTRYMISMGIEKKARQVLLDTTKGEDSYLNSHEIKEKAMAALEEIRPAPPQGTEVEDIIKLRNGSLILQFASKETADWLRVPTNEAAFTKRFDPDTTIRERVHPIMVPRIPITFDPSNPTHLREVEEANGLRTNTIKKARWIKPEYRRAPNQSCAHAIFTITSVAIANILLKDGIYVCNAHTFPTKLKHELKQCMKCRKWGHFAAGCRAQSDTCGTCGGQHRTSNCNVEDKKYCVSCRSDTHSSWSRNCPEFIRKCAEYSSFHPENNLVYFPTEEDWTTTARPSKLAFEDKFPIHLNVGSLPPPNCKERQMPTRPINKQNKRPIDNNNSQVLDNFFDKLVNSQESPDDMPPARVDKDDNEYDSRYEDLQNTMPEVHNQRQHKI